MQYLFQMFIIGVITFIGEVLAHLIPLPVPASVYGIVLLFLVLCLRIIKLEQVEKTADFLLLIMPVLFITPSVGVMESLGDFSDSLPAILGITLISTVIVMTVTGISAELVMRWRKRGKSDE